MSQFGSELKKSILISIDETATEIKDLQEFITERKACPTIEKVAKFFPNAKPEWVEILYEEFGIKGEKLWDYEIRNAEFQAKLLSIEKLMMTACLNVSKVEVYPKYMAKWDETMLSYQEMVEEGVRSECFLESCYLEQCKDSLHTRENVLGLCDVGNKLATGVWKFE